MRLQLIILILFLMQSVHLVAQTKKDNNLPPIEIDFLFSYYTQEGDSSAVTGGQGTEELTDIASLIIVNIPLKDNKSVELTGGVSHYTSASSDKIDPNTISSASYHNLSFLLEGSIIKQDTAKNIARSVNFRGNMQLNFMSAGLGYSFTKFSKDNNRSLTFNGLFNYDIWAPYYNLSKLYPREIRFSTTPLDGNSRYTVDFSTTLNQVINRRMQVGFSAGVIYQWGLLSTPYHRVYFRDIEAPDLERLPGRKIRFPLIGRLNYYLNDWLIIRSFYRFYFDNFGLRAHTINLETPWKINNFFSIYPYYRFYVQNSSRYFAPFSMHEPGGTYYTSDNDLGSFHSNMLGGGLRYSPPTGIIRDGKSESMTKVKFRTVEFRYGQYWRSNGLRAHIFSLNIGFLY